MKRTNRVCVWEGGEQRKIDVRYIDVRQIGISLKAAAPLFGLGSPKPAVQAGRPKQGRAAVWV